MLDLILIYQKKNSETSYSFYHVCKDKIFNYEWTNSSEISLDSSSSFNGNFLSQSGTAIDKQHYYINGTIYALDGTNKITSPPKTSIGAFGKLPFFCASNILFTLDLPEIISCIVFPNSVISILQEDGYSKHTIANKTDYRTILTKDFVSTSVLFSVHGRHMIECIRNEAGFITGFESYLMNPLDLLTSERMFKIKKNY